MRRDGRRIGPLGSRFDQPPGLRVAVDDGGRRESAHELVIRFAEDVSKRAVIRSGPLLHQDRGQARKSLATDETRMKHGWN